VHVHVRARTVAARRGIENSRLGRACGVGVAAIAIARKVGVTRRMRTYPEPESGTRSGRQGRRLRKKEAHDLVMQIEMDFTSNSERQTDRQTDGQCLTDSV
jgi:hypothetical protein